MRKSLKSIAIASAAVLALSAFTGCSPTVDHEQVDSSRTQLYVSNFYGGLRDGWLKAVKARFEEFYAEESFEDGKKGVQVLIDNNQYTGFNFINNLSESYNSVFFTENVMYYDFVNKGLFEDITTEMTTPLTEYGDERSIEDKMYGGYIDYYKTDDGKYYGLPFYEAYPTIAYDIELFETRNYYFAKGGAPSEFCEFTQSNNTDKATGEFSGYKYVGAIGARSAGPDGKYGTNDDGLPATYDEFFTLCEKISGNNIAPIVWPGSAQNYLNELACGLWTDFEGIDKMRANFTLSGKGMDIVTSFDGDMPVTTPTDININNGYLMYQQEGRYHAIDFISRIIRNGYYHPDSFGNEVSQTASQDDFLYGSVGLKTPRVAMLADGSWWQNEANDTYETLAGELNRPNLKKEKKIGSMAFPKATLDEVGQPNTYISSKQTCAFIKKGISPLQLDLAKKFLRFAHTDKSLVEFHQIVNMPKPYDYGMDENDLKECTTFGRDLYEAHKTKNVVFTQSKSKAYAKSPMKFMLTALWNTKMNDNSEFDTLSLALYRKSGSSFAFTAKDVFDGLKNHGEHTAAGWQLNYGEFFK